MYQSSTEFLRHMSQSCRCVNRCVVHRCAFRPPENPLLFVCGVILIPVVCVVVVPICSLQMQLADRYLRESNKTVNSESSTSKSTAKKMLRRQEKEKLHNAPLRFHSHPLTNLSSAHYALIELALLMIHPAWLLFGTIR